jgi:restriction endonuclease Mrr
MGKPVVFYIECKRYGRDQKVGVAVVQRLYGVQTDDKINKAILVTTSRFTSGAKRFAEKQKTLIDLLDIDDFHELLQISADKYRREKSCIDWP